MTAQLDMFAHHDVCQLIAADPTHSRDRAAILDAIEHAARRGGLISGNDWRPHIPPWVYPKVIGATVSSLIRAGVLTPEGPPVRSDDHAGGNAGRWIPQYKFNGECL